MGGGGFWSKGSFRFVLRLERDGYGSVLSMEEGIVQVLHRFGKCSGIESWLLQGDRGACCLSFYSVLNIFTAEQGADRVG